MESKGKTVVKTGICFSELLLIVFVVLKLTHVINWPWIWVLSPLWISVIVNLVFAVILAIIYAR